MVQLFQQMRFWGFRPLYHSLSAIMSLSLCHKGCQNVYRPVKEINTPCLAATDYSDRECGTLKFSLHSRIEFHTGARPPIPQSILPLSCSRWFIQPPVLLMHAGRFPSHGMDELSFVSYSRNTVLINDLILGLKRWWQRNKGQERRETVYRWKAIGQRDTVPGL